MPDLSKLLTTTQAAAKLGGITAGRVRALIRSGRLQAVQAGRDYLIDPASLVAVMNRKPGRPKSAKPPTRTSKRRGKK